MNNIYFAYANYKYYYLIMVMYTRDRGMKTPIVETVITVGKTPSNHKSEFLRSLEFDLRNVYIISSAYTKIEIIEHNGGIKKKNIPPTPQCSNTSLEKLSEVGANTEHPPVIFLIVDVSISIYFF